MAYLIPLVIFFVAYAVLAWRDLSFALAVFVFLLPAHLIRFSIGPLPSTALEIMGWTMLVIWLGKLLKDKKLSATINQLSKSIFFWPGIVLVAVSALTLFWAPDVRAAAGIWKAYFLQPFLIYLLVLDIAQTPKVWRKIFISLGALTLVVAALAIFQRITGLWSPTWEWTVPGMRRVTAFFTSPNALGLLVAPITALYFAWPFYIKLESRNLRVFRLVVILAGLIALALSVSRGAILALVVAVLFLLFSFWSKKWITLIAMAAIALIVLIPSSRIKVIQLATFQNESGQSRLALYEGTYQILKEHPLQGTGLAGFASDFEEVRPEAFTEELIYPHNIFLNFWTETGILGLLTVLWMMGLIFFYATKQKSIFLIALIPILIHGLVDVPYFKNDLAMMTWLFLAGYCVIISPRKL